MVWWTDSDRYWFCRSKFFYHEATEDILNDRIFQTTNIIYSLGELTYDKYEILSLIKSGVNMFNIDLNIHGEDCLHNIKEVIIASENLPEIFPLKYRSPIGLSVTMSVQKHVDIDENVDTVILKDINCLEELLDFKQKYKSVSVPVMLWIESCNVQGLKSMIEFTDGVLLDVTNNSTVESYLEIIKLSKQAFKSIFFVIDDIINDYRLLPVDDFRMLASVSKISKYQYDGVVLYGSNYRENETQSIRSLVRAMDVIQKKSTCDYCKLSLTIKTPVLPWISVSLAASLSATLSGASAIIVLTTSGMSARWIANASPPCHIVAVTTKKEIARRLHLYRKVVPIIYNQINAANWSQECWNRIVFGSTMALESGLCVHGANVVVLAPSNHDIRYCNSLQILSIPLKCAE